MASSVIVFDQGLTPLTIIKVDLMFLPHVIGNESFYVRVPVHSTMEAFSIDAGRDAAELGVDVVHLRSSIMRGARPYTAEVDEALILHANGDWSTEWVLKMNEHQRDRFEVAVATVLNQIGKARTMGGIKVV